MLSKAPGTGDGAVISRKSTSPVSVGMLRGRTREISSIQIDYVRGTTWLARATQRRSSHVLLKLYAMGEPVARVIPFRLVSREALLVLTHKLRRQVAAWGPRETAFRHHRACMRIRLRSFHPWLRRRTHA